MFLWTFLRVFVAIFIGGWYKDSFRPFVGSRMREKRPGIEGKKV